MKRLRDFLLPWLPFAFAAYLCYSTLFRIAQSEAKSWEPAFYAFLPMVFFFVGAVIYQLQRQIRELRATVAKLQAPGSNANVAV
jgi:hypothetical protein